MRTGWASLFLGHRLGNCWDQILHVFILSALIGGGGGTGQPTNTATTSATATTSFPPGSRPRQPTPEIQTAATTTTHANDHIPGVPLLTCLDEGEACTTHAATCCPGLQCSAQLCTEAVPSSFSPEPHRADLSMEMISPLRTYAPNVPSTPLSHVKTSNLHETLPPLLRLGDDSDASLQPDQFDTLTEWISDEAVDRAIESQHSRQRSQVSPAPSPPLPCPCNPPDELICKTNT